MIDELTTRSPENPLLVGLCVVARVAMLVDAKTKVASLAEVLCTDLVVGDLEATLDEVCGFRPPDSYVACDFLVTTDTESTHCVTGNILDWGLVAELLQNADSLRESVTRFTDGDIDDQLVTDHFAHDIVWVPRHVWLAE